MLRKKIKLILTIVFFISNTSQFTLHGITDHEKIAKLFFIGISKQTPLLKLDEFLTQYPVGGIMLYGKPFFTKKELKKIIKMITKHKNAPLFIAVDQEGGKVQRIKFNTIYPKAQEIGKTTDPYQSFLNGKYIGRELSHYGINLNFAPVLDLYQDNNPVINNRSFSKKALTVADMGIAFATGMRSEGIQSVFKHFPGHGRTLTDSHFKTSTTLVDTYTLETTDLHPFIKAIQNNASFIMTSHVLYPAFDRINITTFSKKIINNLLRSQLKYRGIIITDDLTMKAAVNNTKKNVYIDSFDAGVDMLLTIAPLNTIEQEFKQLKTYIIENQKIDLVKERYNRIKTIKKRSVTNLK